MSLKRMDPFTGYLIAVVTLAWLLPASGPTAAVLGWVVRVAIFGLFLSYGVRLSLGEVAAGIRNWRLQAAITASTYLLFPLLGLAATQLADSLLPASLLPGVVFACLVPSTVQSAITLTSLARGNIAAAMVSATWSNLLGVVATPALTWLLLGGARSGIGLAQFVSVVAQLLLPFAIGLALHRRVATALQRLQPRWQYLDQGVILLVVYAAFSQLFHSGAWRQLSPTVLATLLLVVVAVLLLVTGLLWFGSGLLGFSRPDRIALLFCGSHKSVATGVPIAGTIFAATGIGLIVLPLLLYHQAQLLLGAWLAARLRRDNEAAGPSDGSPGPA
ncbi:MAG: hypothetical protein CSA64_03675 [Arachnia propionica]|nr:MAG: hypothetical protein CSA64_03675 [Arachnia propionica]